MKEHFLDQTLPLVEPVEDVEGIVALLQAGRDEILRDWLDRVRDNRAVEAGQALSDPLLLDHVPQLFDAMMDRLAVNRSREDAEQWAAIHGFARRLTGYDVVETVIELLMFRRAIWTQLTAVDAPVRGAYLAMERIDGMVDRAVITSLKAFLDPGARMLRHSDAEEESGDPVASDGGSAPSRGSS